MLVLTRFKDEGFWIGNNVHVVLLGIRGDMVRIGIDAPREVAVLRDEVKAAIENGPEVAEWPPITEDVDLAADRLRNEGE